MKQGVPRWLTTDEEIVAAYIELVDKVCPCVVLVHSQAGAFGFQVAEARPDKVKALVAVEPTVGGDRDKVAALKNTPMLMVFGDYVDQHPRWADVPARRRRLCGVRQGRRRQRRHRRPAGHRAQGQFPHDHDGQEQRRGRRSHPEVAGRQGIGGMNRHRSCCAAARNRPAPLGRCLQQDQCDAAADLTAARALA